MHGSPDVFCVRVEIPGSLELGSVPSRHGRVSLSTSKLESFGVVNQLDERAGNISVRALFCLREENYQPENINPNSELSHNE